MNSGLKQYTIVLRCSQSMLRVPQGRGIRIAPMRSEYGEYELKVVTRTDKNPKISTPIPRELWIEVTGPAPSIEAALNVAVASADEYVRQIAFASNAWQGLLAVHLAYESTPGARERVFFQNWIQDEAGLPRVARDINPDLAFRLLVAITSLSDHDRSRLMRAVIQYSDALQHWKPGGELYALTHLYMGIEAITPLSIAQEVKRRGLKSRKELERELRGPPADSLALRFATLIYRRAGGSVTSKLDSWARRELIFRGDKETFRTAKGASDKLEHGLAHHSAIHELAKKSVGKTAGYLREAMLSFLPLSPDDMAALKGEKFAKPAGTGGFERQLLATLTANNDEVAAGDQAYPHVRWEFNLLDFSMNDDGSYEMRVNQKITPVLGTDVSMALTRVHFAGPTTTKHADVEVEITRNTSEGEQVVTAAGAHLSVDDPAISPWIQPFGSFLLNSNALVHLARFWLTKLAPASDVHSLGLVEAVDSIQTAIAEDSSTAVLSAECNALWAEAVSVDEARATLSHAYSRPEGLVVPKAGADNEYGVVTELDLLRQLNDRTVQLVRQLSLLLDRAISVRQGSEGSTDQ